VKLVHLFGFITEKCLIHFHLSNLVRTGQDQLLARGGLSDLDRVVWQLSQGRSVWAHGSLWLLCRLQHRVEIIGALRS